MYCKYIYMRDMLHSYHIKVLHGLVLIVYVYNH